MAVTNIIYYDTEPQGGLDIYAAPTDSLLSAANAWAHEALQGTSTFTGVVRFLFKGNVPGELLSDAINIHVTEDNGQKFATITSQAHAFETTVAITGSAIVGAIATCLALPAVAAVAVAAAGGWVYTEYGVDGFIYDTVDAFTGTIDTDFVLRSSNGDVLGGAFCVDGVANHFEERTVARNLINHIVGKGAQVNGAKIDVLLSSQQNLSATYHVQEGSVYDAVIAILGTYQGGRVSFYGNGTKIVDQSVWEVTTGGVTHTVYNKDDTFYVRGIGSNGEGHSFRIDNIKIGDVFFQDSSKPAEGFNPAEDNLILDASVNVDGGAGDDYIFGSDINYQILQGGIDNDHLYGRGGIDELIGGDGTDYLDGGIGNDKLFGGVGSDVLDGGEDDDTALYTDSTTGVTVSLASGTGAGGDAQGDELKNIESLTGSQYGDTLIGGASAGKLSGLGGQDNLVAGSDRDTLLGGDDADFLWNEHSSTLLDGGAGNDLLTSTSGKSTLDGGAGNDTLVATLNAGKTTFVYGKGRGADAIMSDTGQANILRLEGLNPGDIEVLIENEVPMSVNYSGWDGYQHDVVIRIKETQECLLLPRQFLRDTSFLTPEDIIQQPIKSVKFANGTTWSAEQLADEIVVVEDLLTQIPKFDYHSSNFKTDRQIDSKVADSAQYSAVYNLLTGTPNSFGPLQSDPLVIDLDGNGIELTALDPANPVYFDIDADLFAESIGWVGPNDGLLAIDRNVNGSIDGITELFGDADTNAYDDLATLDSNGDGQISSADAEFANLKVWQDSNGNAITDAGELKTLGQAGIQSIDLSTVTTNTDINGNTVTRTGNVVRSDSTVTTAGSVNFLVNQTDTQFQGTWGPHRSLTENLPQLRGYGDTPSLQHAMSNDPTLIEMVTEYALTDQVSAGNFFDQVEEIMLRWAGVQDVATDSRGPNFDGQILAGLEKFMGSQFVSEIGFSTDPTAHAGQELQNIWDDFVAKNVIRLGIQGAKVPLFQDLMYDPNTGDVFGPIDAVTFIEDFQNAVLGDVVSVGLSENNRQAAVERFYDIIKFADAAAPNMGLAEGAFDAAIEARLDAVGMPLDLADFRKAQTVSQITGDFKNNLIIDVANDGNVMEGGNFNTYNFGERGDVYWGGAGDDHITSNDYESDIFIFDRGDGRDVIFDVGGTNDTVRFGPGLSPADVVFERSAIDGSNMVVKIVGTGDQMVVTDQLSNSSTGQIENFEFSDGTVLSAAVVKQTILDNLQTAGNDVIKGYSGDDILQGGTGDDYLVGDFGNDTYIFNLGDGADSIEDGGGTDTIQFGTGITADGVTFSRNPIDSKSLLITIDATGDQIEVKGQFGTTNVDIIENFTFTDGTVLGEADITARILADMATVQNDFVEGTGANETISGGTGGNDYLQGAGGNDVYTFEAGFGRDTIRDTSGTDTVRFGAGITPADVTVSKGWDPIDVILTVGNSGDELTLRAHGHWRNGYRIENIEFDDGTVWTYTDLATMLSTWVDPTPIQGTTGVDTLVGTSGNDKILGDKGGDTIDGGAGNDRLEGGDHDDVYLFESGFGIDEISDSNGTDTVRFGVGITPADLLLSRHNDIGTDLRVDIAGTSDSLTIVNQFGSGSNAVENFEFDDGTVMTLAEIRQALIDQNTTTGNDAIEGFSSANDVFNSSAGNDALMGNDGNDTYHFDLGSGSDVITEWQGTDKIVFGPGILPTDLVLTSTDGGMDLRIDIAGTSDSLTINSQFDAWMFEIESFEFADGTVWTASDVRSQVLLQGNTPDDAVIDGFTTNDVLDGGAGNDVLRGNTGDDTYHFDVGYGYDYISEWEGTDTVVFGAGITAADLTLSRSGGGNDLRIDVNTTDDSLVINEQFGSSMFNVENFQFADGSSWTMADVQALSLVGNDGIDNITGFDTNDALVGNGGNDTLSGGAGDDTLDGGTGVDTLDGGLGIDTALYGAAASTYSYSMSDGNLVVSDASGADTLIDVEKAQFSDLTLHLDGSVDNAAVVGDVQFGAAENDSLTITEADLLAKGFDVEGGMLSITGVTLNGVTGALVDNLDGTWTYTPPADWFGDVSLSFTVFDGVNSTVATANVDVYEVNLDPVGVLDASSTAIDTPVTLAAAALLANDSDPDGDPLSIVSTGSAFGGSAAIDEFGDVVFTPDVGFTGTANFTYWISDGKGGFGPATVEVIIMAENTAPVAGAPSFATNEDTAITVSAAELLAGSSDLEGDALSVSGVALSDAGAGALVDNLDGTWTFTPSADWNGGLSLDYSIGDGTATVPGSASLTVASVNDNPVAVGDTAATSEDTAVTILASALLANDTDVDGDVLSLASVSSPVGGTVALDGNGDVVFTPDANFNGTATFDYTVDDGAGGTSTTTVSVNVAAVNDAPVVGAPSFATNEDTAITVSAAELLAGSTDLEGDALSVSGVALSDAGAGALVDNLDGTWTFTPSADWNGGLSLDYSVSDGTASVAGSASLTVNAINDNPVAVGDTAATSEDTAVTILASALLANDTDVDGDVLSLASVSSPVGGTVALDGNGDVVFTPDANFNGTATFDYTVDDGAGGTSTTTVSVDVAAVNDAPVVGAPSFATNEDTAITVSAAELLAGSTDLEGDALSVSGVVLSDLGAGALVDNLDGTWTFTPSADWNGGLSLDYSVSDGTASVAGSASLTVNAVNDNPVAVADAVTTDEDTVLTFSAASLLVNDSDVDGDALSIVSIDTTGTQGAVSDNGDGTYSYDPGTGFHSLAVGENALDTFTYTVGDGAGGTVTQTVTITITGTVTGLNIVGTAGDDVFTGLVKQNDMIDGLAGTDTVSFTGNFSDYEIYRTPDGAVVRDTRVNGDGRDVLVNIEKLSFADGVYDLTTGGPTTTATETSETQVDSTTTTQVRPSMAALQGGGYVVTWDGDSSDESGYGVFAQRYDANGVAVGTETLVNTYTADPQVAASVIGLADGGYVVTWESSSQDGSGYGIYGQRYDAIGSTIGAEFLINTNTNLQQMDPEITALQDGGFMVTWWSSDPLDGDGMGVFAQRYDATGTKVDSEFQVNSTGQGNQLLPTVSTLESGAVVSIWASYGQDGDSYGIYGKVYDATGSVLVDEFLVNTETLAGQYLPSVTAMADGGFMVMWDSENQDGNGQGIFGQRYDSQGEAIGVEFQVNTTTWSTQENAEVTALANGGFMAVWVSAGQDGSDLGIFGQQFDAAGTAVGAEFQVNDYTTGRQIDPDIITLSDGRVVVSWTSTLQGGIYTKTYTVTENGMTIDGSLDNDIFIGGAGDDTLNGGAGDDTIDGGSGNDTSDGGAGADTATYNGNYADYDITTNPDGSVTVMDMRADGDGTDMLTNIENLQFADGTLDLTIPEAEVIVSDGGEVQVNTITAGFQMDPVVTGLSGGGYVVSWGTPDANSIGIAAQIYDASGTKVGSEFQVNTYETAEQYQASIAALSDGGFVVSWTSLGQDGSSYGVYAQRYNASGATVGVEFNPSTYTDSVQYLSDVTGLSDGGYVITWSSNGEDGSNYGIYGQRYDSAGDMVGAKFRANTTTSNHQVQSSVSELAGGGFVVTWQSRYQDEPSSGTYGIYGQMHDATGAAVGSELAINTHVAGEQRYSSVTGLADGGFVVTWQSDGQDGDGGGIYAQRYASDGTTVGTEFSVNTTTADKQIDPHVTSLNDGGFMVSWTSYGQDGSENGIIAQRFDGAGVAVGNELVVNDYTTSTQAYSDISTLADGSVVVTWHSYQNGSYNVYSKTYSITTEGLVVTGSSINDIIIADEGDDILDGAGGNDQIFGEGGDDLLTGGSGNDTIDGGAGSDTAVFSGNAADYITTAVSGGIQVAGPDGTDTLIGVETLQFSDRSVSVIGSNTLPDAVSDSVSVTEDTTVTFLASELAANDFDMDVSSGWQAFSIAAVTNAIGGTVSLDGSGDVVFTPDPDFTGAASFDYTIDDGSGGLSTASVTVDVVNVNDAPTGSVTISGVIAQNQTLTVANTLADADGIGTVSYQWKSNGNPIANATGSSYVLTESEVDAIITVEAVYTDGHGTLETVSSVATVAVEPFSTPSAINSVMLTSEDTPETWLLSVEGGVGELTYELAFEGAPTNGTVTFDAVTGEYTYDPIDGFVGADSFTYTVTDVLGASSTATVDLTIGSVGESSFAPVSQLDVLRQNGNFVVDATGAKISRSGASSNTYQMLTAMPQDGKYFFEIKVNSFDGSPQPQFGFLKHGDVSVGDAYSSAIKGFRFNPQTSQYGISLDGASSSSGTVSGIPQIDNSLGGQILSFAVDMVSEPGEGGAATGNVYVGMRNSSGDNITWFDRAGNTNNSNDGSFDGLEAFYSWDTATEKMDFAIANTNNSGNWEMEFNFNEPAGSKVLPADYVPVADGIAIFDPMMGLAADVMELGGNLSLDANGVLSRSGASSNTYQLLSEIPQQGKYYFEFEFTGFDLASSPQPQFGLVERGDVSIGDSFTKSVMGFLYNPQETEYRFDGVYQPSLNSTYSTSIAKLDTPVTGFDDHEFMSFAVDMETGKAYIGMREGSGASITWFDRAGHTSTGSDFGSVEPFYTWDPSTQDMDLAVANTNNGGSWTVELNTDGAGVTLPSGFFAANSGGISVPSATPGHDSFEGGADADTFNGLAGDDQLIGNGGDDVLTGGAGDDTYQITRGDGQDTINNIGEGGAADKVSYGAGVDHDQLWFSQAGNDLIIQIIGTTDQVSISDWYGSAANQVAGIETADGFNLSNAVVSNLVNAMAGMTPPPVGQTELTAAEHTSLDPVIVANWLPQ